MNLVSKDAFITVCIVGNKEKKKKLMIPQKEAFEWFYLLQWLFILNKNNKRIIFAKSKTRKGDYFSRA